MRPRSFTVVGSCLALILIVSGVAAARPAETPPPAAAPVDPADSGPLVQAGPAPDLVLLYTGSVIGYVEPCG